MVTAIEHVGTSPSLLAFVDAAAERVDVTFMSRRSEVWPAPSFTSPGVKVVLSPWSRRRAFFGVTALRQALDVLRECRRSHPTVLVAVNPEVLAFAGPIALAVGVRLVHFSLEVRFGRSLGMRLKKWLERALYPHVEFTIIQDPDRARALLESNGLAETAFEYLPNSAGDAGVRSGDNQDWRCRWGVSEESSVVLTAGCIARWAMVRELVLAAQDWPDGRVLIVHGWSDDPPYLASVRGLFDGRHSVLSEEVVPFEELRGLISAADVGLALYRSDDPNMVVMGQASGKMWQYLRAGVPVVASRLPGLAEFVEGEGVGVCVDGVEGLAAALDKVLGEHEAFKAAAATAYVARWTLGGSLDRILDRLLEAPA